MLDFALTQPNLADYCLRLNVRPALFWIAKITRERSYPALNRPRTATKFI